jgi:hypothetical protein
MSNSNADVIELFKKGITNKRSVNVYSEGNVVYSYGPHFPLVVRRDEKSNLKDGKEWYLLNGDKYSKTTSTHQSITYSVFHEHPRVSFSAIHAAGINEQTCELVDFWKDEFRSTYPGDEDFDDFEKTVPVGAELRIRRKEDGTIISKSYHRIGSVVLRQDGKYFLCSMDEGSYFVSELPAPVKTVTDAFESLKPDAVRKAEAQRLEIKRQGEWFFIPIEPPSGVHKKDFKSQYVLPAQNSRSNLHIATRGILYKGNHLVMGTIRHKSPWGRNGEHRMLRLGSGVFIAVCNTSKGNWSANGKVD